MQKEKISFYYKNVTDKIIGQAGITQKDFDALAPKTIAAVKLVNAQREGDRTPYRDLPYRGESVKQVQKLAEQIRNECENFVVLGIGGSALGNIALQTALNPYMYNVDEKQRRGPKLFVFDNVDPMQFSSFLNWIEDKLEQTVFNVISKSGQTAETAAQLLVIQKLLTGKLGSKSLSKNIVAITDAKEGLLRRIAQRENLRSLDVPQGVGGRFSVLSCVGLLSAAVCGIDIEELLAGAADMDKIVSSEDFYANPAAINAAIHYYFYNRGKNISVMMPYNFALKDLADWFRQLWAESLGKVKEESGKTINIGQTPVKALGATDQHSQVQLYREGPNDKLFTFLQVENFAEEVKIGLPAEYTQELKYLGDKDMGELLNSEKKATEYALLMTKRPCITVIFPKVNEYTVGQFIYLYEVTTSIAGELLGVNAYDQPAVELGKQATFALMGKEGNTKDGIAYDKFRDTIKKITKLDEKYLV